MSGGHFSYSGARLEDELDNIARDLEVVDRFPELSKVLLEMGKILREMEHDMDWDFSGDKFIKNDRSFENEVLNKIFSAVQRFHQ